MALGKIISPRKKRQICRQRQSGLTILELLLVVSIMAVISATAVAALLTSVRTTRKGDAQLETRQAGDFAIRTISETIRRARTVTGLCQTGMTSINLEMADGSRQEFSCAVDGLVKSGEYLVSPTAGLAVSDCQFSCQTSVDGVAQAVEVTFTLSKGSGAEGYQTKFNTTVTTRNH